ncbi:MAG: retron Eco8 family effector endonuclease [Lachnospiraceae bacterium]|nr:retron Eco8 family effector endonuclease [Lachnospiraceae bacterium]
MAIQKIQIWGYRSISYMELQAGEIVAFIGQNGSGKSNILSALHFFYRNLTRTWEEKGCFDSNNFFRNEIRICITYDLQGILRMIQHNEKEFQQRESDLEEERYENYYQKVQAISGGDQIVLELFWRKGQTVEWNADYNVRQIVASLFPVYFVDARMIALDDWTNLWELLGDLVKLKDADSKSLLKSLEEWITCQGNGIGGKTQKLKKYLEESGIGVKGLTSRQLGEDLAELMLGGRVFQYEEHSLKANSNGTNSFYYIRTLLEILCLVKEYKMKEPIVILDEPEISLHLGKIDELMEHLFEASGKLQFFLSTHSARCVKNLMEQEEADVVIYHAALVGRCTQGKQIRTLSGEELRERVILSETYTNVCFAKMMVSVEGDTEFEVLKNRYLREIFPFLKEVELVQGMSNQIVQNLTEPDRRNYQTPGISVIDMDKVLKKQKNCNCFQFSGLRHDGVRKEKYAYGQKRTNTLYLRNRILNMCEKCRFYYNYPLFSCEDENFRQMLNLIREYCLSYHIFVWNTTIEGALITRENMKYFLTFMPGELKNEENMKIAPYAAKCNENGMVNYCRMIFSGKSDYVLSKKELKSENPGIEPELFSTLSTVKKTSGWVSRWLEYICLSIAEIDVQGKNAYREFCKYIRKPGNRFLFRQHFKKYFEELTEFLGVVEKVMT